MIVHSPVPSDQALVLASGSTIRQRLLTAAGVPFSVLLPRVDEDLIRAALLGEGAKPRDMADMLAEAKARKVAERNSDRFVLGCDQILELEGAVLSKPKDIDDARGQLALMRGKTHRLWSAAVIYHEAKPVWRVVTGAKMTMRNLSDAYLDDYLSRNWEGIRSSVGCYKLEEEGARLFSVVEGDYFTVLGLPLLPVLGYLADRGLVPS